jgi:hypothetical protein
MLPTMKSGNHKFLSADDLLNCSLPAHEAFEKEYPFPFANDLDHS